MTKTTICPKCQDELELTFDRHLADDGIFYILAELKCFGDNCEYSADEVEVIENANPVTCDDIDADMNAMFELEAELAYDDTY